MGNSSFKYSFEMNGTLEMGRQLDNDDNRVHAEFLDDWRDNRMFH